MTSSTGAGAVNSLRAMFEEKLSSSPPSRGRSPSGFSDIHSIRSTSSRPVSKIRTSFVAVEKSGQMGGTILGLRRVSDTQDNTEPESTRPTISRSHSNTIEDDIIEENEKEDEKEGPSKTPTTKGNSSNPNPSTVPVNGSKETVQTSVGLERRPVPKQKVAGHAINEAKGKITVDTTKGLPGRSSAPNSAKKQPSTPKEIPEKGKVAVKKPASIATKTSVNGLRTRSNIKPKISPTTPRTPTSATKAAAAKRELIAKPDSRTTTPRKSFGQSIVKENKPIKNGPRSPTKPVRLPAGALATTASSAAKTASDRPSPHSSAKPRTSTDGDFLARMMRPTAASASKVHEKVATKSSPKTTPQKTLSARPKRTSGSVSKVEYGRDTAAESTMIDEKDLCSYPGNAEPEPEDESPVPKEVQNAEDAVALVHNEQSVEPVDAAEETSELKDVSKNVENHRQHQDALPIKNGSETSEAEVISESKDAVVSTHKSPVEPEVPHEQPKSEGKALELTSGASSSDHQETKSSDLEEEVGEKAGNAPEPESKPLQENTVTVEDDGHRGQEAADEINVDSHHEATVKHEPQIETNVEVKADSNGETDVTTASESVQPTDVAKD